MLITLKPITRDNYRACTRLEVAADQERFVAPNTYSLAQACYELECTPLAIYTGDTMVGFAMYALDPDDHKYWIYRLMIDAAHQGKGYGRAAMKLLIEHIRHLPGCDEIAISYVPENGAAKQLYASLGFVESGEVIEHETVARLHLQPSQAAT